MNFKGLKSKLARFKQIFTDHWSAFVIKHPRYNSDYYCAEITKMLDCGSKATGFAVYQCFQSSVAELTIWLSSGDGFSSKRRKP